MNTFFSLGLHVSPVSMSVSSFIICRVRQDIQTYVSYLVSIYNTSLTTLIISQTFLGLRLPSSANKHRRFKILTEQSNGHSESALQS
jgi:hypothetical protein